MKPASSLLALMTLCTLLSAQEGLENRTCKACHPKIYQEYKDSIHSKASIFSDPIHRAVWDKHPAKAKGNYNCAKCHTPSDHALLEKKAPLQENAIQQTEPISCQQCHRIESIEKHSKSNTNILTKKKKYFFAADTALKGQVIKFKEESSFFGLFTKTTGSPYHTIDYSNELFYNGDVCMGCHSHKENGKGFIVCDLEVKQGNSKETCISCHMPKVAGPLANQKVSGKHAFHGNNIHSGTPKTLTKYLHLDLAPNDQGFTVSIKNDATHTLFPQPLRLAQLRVSIEREGKTITLEPHSFARVIGTDGKPAMPWLADSVLSDTTIKALETRQIAFDTPLKKGDEVLIEFGYYAVNPKVAEKLGLDKKQAGDFSVLKKKRIAR
jgi:hypothetical protein